MNISANLKNLKQAIFKPDRLILLVFVVVLSALVLAVRTNWALVQDLVGEDLALNLVAETIGVIAEIAIVYLLISVLLKRREKTRYRPAREVMAKKLASLHKIIFLAAQISVLPNSRMPTSPDPEGRPYSDPQASFEYRQRPIATIDFHLKELKEAIDLGGGALDDFWMPLIYGYYSSAKIVHRKLSFLISIFEPQNADKDFVFEFPKEEICEMEKCYREIEKVLPDAIKTSETIAETKSASEILDLWSELVDENNRIFDDPAKFKSRPTQRLVVVESIQVMKRLGGMADKQPVYAVNYAT